MTKFHIWLGFCNPVMNDADSECTQKEGQTLENFEVFRNIQLASFLVAQ